MTSQRIYYDPRDVHPRMLTDSEIQSLSPTECAIALEQLDQNLVTTLQAIDANFVRATRAVTDKILPAVEKYGEASRDIWASVKFWKTFYETAAGIRLTDLLPEEGHTVEEASEAETTVDRSEASEADVTIHPSALSDASVETVALQDEPKLPPAKVKPQPTNGSKGNHPTFATVPSELDKLHRDMLTQFGLNYEASSHSVLSPSPPRASTSLSSKDTLDSPHLVPPELETISLGDLPGFNKVKAVPRSIKGKEKSRALYEDRLTRELPPTVARAVLNSQRRPPALKGGAATSTPARGRAARPLEVDSPDWNGLTDLSKTPLSAFRVPLRSAAPTPRTQAKEKEEERLADLMQPLTVDDTASTIDLPSMDHFTFLKARTPARTPARDAAQHLTREVLDTLNFRDLSDLENSPDLAPPSVLRNWRARGYDASPDVSPSRRTVASTTLMRDEGEDLLAPLPQDESQDLLGDVDFSFAPIDGEGEAVALDEWGNSFEGEMADESGASFGVGPEDTVFGGRKSLATGALQPTGRLGERRSGPFQIKGLQGDLMDTLHGGELLQSEPFQNSPLAGRDAKYGL